MVNYACASGVLCRTAGLGLESSLPTDSKCNICDTSRFHERCVTPLMSILTNEAVIENLGPEVKAALQGMHALQVAQSNICVKCAQPASDQAPQRAESDEHQGDEAPLRAEPSMSSPTKVGRSSARLSGTPASQQRPATKIRPSGTTPARAATVTEESLLSEIPDNYLAAGSPQIDDSGLVPPPDLFGVGSDLRNLFLNDDDVDLNDVVVPNLFTSGMSFFMVLRHRSVDLWHFWNMCARPAKSLSSLVTQCSGAKGPKKAPKKGPKMTDIESEMVDFIDGFQLVDEDAEEEEIERMAAYANSDKDEPNLNFDFVFNDLEFREMNKKIEEGLSRECF